MLIQARAGARDAKVSGPTLCPLSIPDVRFCGYDILRRDLLTGLPLLLSDLSAILMGWGMAQLLHHVVPTAIDPLSLGFLAVALVLVPLTFGILELYPAVGMTAPAEIKRQLTGLSILFVESLAVVLLWTPFTVQRLAAVSFFGAMLVVFLVGFRMVTRWLVSRFDWWKQPTYLFGTDWEIRQWRDCLEQCPELGMRWTTHEAPCRALVTGRAAEELGLDAGDLARMVPRIITVASDQLNKTSTKAERLELLTQPAIKNRLLLPQYRFVKRVFDLSLVTFSLPVLLPLVAVVSLIVKTTSPGPIFFGQERPGRNGVRFRAWKFRTMVVDAEAQLERYLASDPSLRDEWEQNHKLRHDPRITSIGWFLRATSLDELPQLWNVAVGDMSLVGPRPILESQIDDYGPTFDLYATALPGLTGLWQTSGRSDTTFAQRLAYDAYYIRNWSPWLDIYLLLRTINVVLSGQGAY